jgi:predicted TIM-barrel fold metal-dependent hydrolase
MLRNMPVVAIEEHYWDKELADLFASDESPRRPEQLKRLYDFDELRLGEMDAAGVDIQVISHGAPSTQRLKGQNAVDIASRVNDRLAAHVARHPKRYAAFTALPTDVPEAAARELERCVKQLGFKGAMTHGLSNGEFLDMPRFRPMFEAADALDVPIYLHPANPVPSVAEAYYNDYAKTYPMVIRPAWGFTVETATQAIRLILSGVFKDCKRLQIILGHFGETLPFLLWRINQALSRPGQDEMRFRDIFCNHFHVTTSGHFSTPALLCTMLEMGIDRIMFSVDWPFVVHDGAMDWAKSLQMNDHDMAKFLGGNAKRLLKL